VNLAQLGNFLRVVEEQSFSKAASIVRIAQPALSRQVRALEADLGAPLLVRHAWGVTPTPAGEALADSARRILQDVQAARDAVSAIDTEPSGEVTLGAPSSIAAALFPALLRTLKAKYPRIRPRFIDELSAPLHQRTLRGERDLAILHNRRAMGPLSVTPLLHEGIGLVGQPDLLAGFETPATEVLKALPLILPTRPNWSRALMDEVMGGDPANLVAEVDCLPAALPMVASGEGFTLLPFCAVHAWVERGELGWIGLAAPEFQRELMLARPPDRRPSPATIALEREIRRQVEALQSVMRWRCLFPS